MNQSTLSVDTREALFSMMCRIRAFEEAADRASQGGVAAFGQSLGGAASVRGPLHLSIGQEAVPTGVCAHLVAEDLLTSTHRGHGHTLAKGADAERMMLELYGKAGGYCGGRGGSMHIADFSVGMLGANGVVAAGMPIAVGAAQALKIRGTRNLAVSFFGDGAINRGPFGESLNWAAAYSLPVLFVCEDNQWSATTRTSAMSAGEGAAARARAYGVEAETVDGMDCEAVYRLAGSLVDAIRADGRPRLLHAMTYRFTGHVSVDPAGYRDPAEVTAAKERDPITLARADFSGNGLDAERLDAIAEEAHAEIERAVAAAQAAPWPSLEVSRQEVQDLASPDWI